MREGTDLIDRGVFCFAVPLKTVVGYTGARTADGFLTTIVAICDVCALVHGCCRPGDVRTLVEAVPQFLVAIRDLNAQIFPARPLFVRSRPAVTWFLTLQDDGATWTALVHGRLDPQEILPGLLEMY
jgi:hypothetical protein